MGENRGKNHLGPQALDHMRGRENDSSLPEFECRNMSHQPDMDGNINYPILFWSILRISKIHPFST